MATKSELRYEKRRLAVEAVQRGEMPQVVAKVMGFTRQAIYNWLSSYRAGGFDGLKDGRKLGRPKKLNAKIIAWLYDAIKMGDPRQQKFDFALWSLRVIRLMLYKKWGIKLSKSSISRLLRQLGISPQKPVYKAYSQDSQAVERWKNHDFPRIKKVGKRHKNLFTMHLATARNLLKKQIEAKKLLII